MFNWMFLITPMSEVISGNSNIHLFWHFSGTFGHGLVQLYSFGCLMFEAMSGNSDINLFIFGIFQELLGMDVLHKFNWIRLIARMFEAMAGNFAYASDIHLFINVINGSLALHAGRIFL